MTLTNPPQVKIGDSAWLTTEWAPDISATQVTQQIAAGANKMTVRDVQYMHWTVKDGDTPEQVYRLLVAGNDAETKPPGVLVLAVGRYTTKSRVLDVPEDIEAKTGAIIVTD